MPLMGDGKLLARRAGEAAALNRLLVKLPETLLAALPPALPGVVPGAPAPGTGTPPPGVDGRLPGAVPGAPAPGTGTPLPGVGGRLLLGLASPGPPTPMSAFSVPPPPPPAAAPASPLSTPAAAASASEDAEDGLAANPRCCCCWRCWFDHRDGDAPARPPAAAGGFPGEGEGEGLDAGLLEGDSAATLCRRSHTCSSRASTTSCTSAALPGPPSFVTWAPLIGIACIARNGRAATARVLLPPQGLQFQGPPRSRASHTWAASIRGVLLSDAAGGSLLGGSAPAFSPSSQMTSAARSASLGSATCGSPGWPTC